MHVHLVEQMKAMLDQTLATVLHAMAQQAQAPVPVEEPRAVLQATRPSHPRLLPKSQH